MDLIRYAVFHAWRTWFFATLFIFGTWFARGFDLQTGAALLLGHGAVYLSFGAIARRLYEIDWQCIADGVYPMPHDATLWGVLRWSDPRRVLAFCAAARETAERAARGGWRELPKAYPPVPNGSYPSYYLQNFHFQTDGWLSAASANSYEVSTEVLFGGTQDAMQRLALVPVREWLRGRREGDGSVELLEAACGTGRLLCQLAESFPEFRLTGLDLSPFYLEEARANYARWQAGHPGSSSAEFVHANAEALPLPDRSRDIVVCAYTFHELPPATRRSVAAEFFRVLRPGGLCVLMDSAQEGDLGPGLEGALEWFPRTFHEPYYRSWLAEDLGSLFGACGFQPSGPERVMHVTKVGAFLRPHGS